MEKINLLSYFEQIAKKNGISSDNVINRLKDAINSTYSKNFPGKNIKIDIDTNKNALEIIELYNVVNDHDDLDDYNEIAVETIKGYKVGEVYQKKVDLSKLPTNILQMFVKTFLRGVVADSNIQTYNA
jgi:N utilization substance protein A